MINVKFCPVDDSPLDVTVNDTAELKTVLGTVLEFIRACNGKNSPAPENKSDEHFMFTPEELRDNKTPVTAEVERVFNPQPPLPIPVSVTPNPIYTDAKLDSEGKPWNPDIHSRTKSKDKKTGKWKVKRGLETEPEVTSHVTPQTIPMPAPSQISSQPQHAPETFNTLMMKVNSWILKNLITRDQVDQAARNLGLPSIIAAADAPNLIPALSVALFTLAGSPQGS